MARLRRTARRLAAEGIAEEGLLGRAAPQPGDGRLVPAANAARFGEPVGGTAAAAPGRTPQRIAAQLEGTRWHPSSVRSLPPQAERLGVGRQSIATR